jgi:hypothetical protein
MIVITEDMAARGSDDEYCSAYPLDGHHYVAHSVLAPPIRWVDRCQLCGRISNRSLRDQLDEPVALPLLLGKLTPEAKRELASQLLRSASDDEGYHEDTA